MAGEINVDTTGESVTVKFADDHGNPTAPPEGAKCAFFSDNSAVATVAVDPNNPFQGDIKPVGIGIANISASVYGSDGKVLAQVDPVQVTVQAGAASTESLVLSI